MTIFYSTVGKQVVGHFANEDAASAASNRYCARHNLPEKAITITAHRVFATASEHEHEYLLGVREQLMSRLTDDEKAALALVA